MSDAQKPKHDYTVVPQVGGPPALSQPIEEIRQEGGSLSETTDVLPVLECFVLPLTLTKGLEPGFDRVFKRSKVYGFDLIPVSIVPEGYRVIREEDHHRQVREAVEEIAGKFKHAMRACNGGFDHVMICPEDGHSYFDEFIYYLIDRLTDIEGQT